MSTIFQDETPTTIDAGLQSRALLVTLSYHCWTNQRVVREADNVVAGHFGLKDNVSTRTTKYLVDRKAIRPIELAIDAMERAHRTRTLPWLDGGTRVLSAAGYFAYTTEMRKLHAVLEVEVAKLEAQWDRLVAESLVRLNGLANAADYPKRDELASRFSVETRMSPVPSTDDIRFAVGEEEVERIKKHVSESNDAALKGAFADITERVTEVAKRCEFRLRNYKPKARGMERAEGDFKSSLITNAIELADLLPSLNFMNDSRIAGLEYDLRKLARYDMEDLKTDSGCRKETADRAAAILAKINDFV